MNKTWDSLTPKEIKKALIISGVFLIISLLVFIFLNKILGLILLMLWGLFGFGPFAFILESGGLIKNKIYVLKTVEPGYKDWKDDEIVEQIKAIEECGYKWFEKKGKVGFKHSETGLYLKIEGLNFYSPEDIKKTYKEVWSKTDPEKMKKKEKAIQKVISNIDPDENYESVLEKIDNEINNKTED